MEARAEIRRRAEKIAAQDSLAWIKLHKPRIVAPEGQDVPFEPFDYQRQVLVALDAGGPVIANKGRQIGFSTCVMIQKLRRIMTAPGITVLVVSRTGAVAIDLVRRARLAYHSLAEPKPQLVTDNKQELELDNGSRIIAERASEEAGRTYAASDVVFDEFAHCAWQEQMWRSVRPTVSATGNIAVISTPNGEGDLYEQLWTRITRRPLEGEGRIDSGDSDWAAFRLPWNVQPNRDEAWRERERKDYTDADWRQEYECDFLSAAAAIFAAEAIARCIERGSHWLPRIMGRAIIGVDVAGQGRDETVITTLDASQKPYWITETFASEDISAVPLQREIERRQGATGAEVGIDYTGVGYGVAENLSIPHKRVLFTGGSAVSQDGNLWRVPRERLLSNAIQVIERGDIAINPKYQELITALRTARWEKRQGSYVDHLDSLLIALWLAEKGGADWWIV